MTGFVLNARPVEHRARFHAAFTEALGPAWRIVDCPVLTAEPLSVQLPPAGGFDLILFTSQIAAAVFPVGDVWAGKKVLAVGEATAKAARAAGFTRVIDTGKDVDDMRAYLAQDGFRQALYPSADDVAADLAQEFPGKITRLVTYRMVPRTRLDLDALAPGWNDGPVLVPLFSRRSAETLAALLSKVSLGRANITAVAISADALAPGPWARTAVADDPTLAGVAAACARAAELMEKTP